ncbi:MAG TPA: hypothetical protein VGC67_13570 [Cellulomonas sp.]
MTGTQAQGRPAVDERAVQRSVEARRTFAGLVRSEWLKLRTLRSTCWTLGLVVAMQIAMAVTEGASLATSYPDGIGSHGATTLASLAAGGVSATQFAVMVLGVLCVTGEYRTGQVRSTFNADPGRVLVLAAKGVVVAGLTFITSFAAMVVSGVVLRVMAGDLAAGMSYLDLTAVRITVGAPLYLSLIALMSLALGAALRRAGAAICAVLVIVMALPGTASMFPGGWVGTLVSYLPGSAGAAIYDAGATVADSTLNPMAAAMGGGTVMLPAWLGLLVLAGWVALIWGWGVSATQRRDV